MHNCRFITLSNGLKTRVFDSRTDGEPLVLVHGLANSIEIWSRITNRLSGKFRVLAFDLPGFGMSDRPKSSYDSDFFVDQLRAFMDTMELQTAHLVGYSLGGSIIVRYASKHPERIDRVVVSAPGGFGRDAHLLMRLPALPVIGYALGKPTAFNNRLTLRLAMHDRAHITDELVELTNRYAAIAGSHRAFVLTLQSGVGVMGIKDRERFADAARSLQRPVLLVWGRQDRVFPCSHSDIAVSLLPDCHRLLVDECGHYPHWEQPDRFAAAVEDHLVVKRDEH